MLRDRHATAFGFTESEVQQICEALAEPGLPQGLREMYNGYLAAGLDQAPIAVYNPWSVLSPSFASRRISS